MLSPLVTAVGTCTMAQLLRREAIISSCAIMAPYPAQQLLNSTRYFLQMHGDTNALVPLWASIKRCRITTQRFFFFLQMENLLLLTDAQTQPRSAQELAEKHLLRGRRQRSSRVLAARQEKKNGPATVSMARSLALWGRCTTAPSPPIFVV